MGFKMKGFSGFTQKSGDYPGKDPITGGDNATYEKRSGEIMQKAKDEAKKKGYKPGTANYQKLMEKARKKREAVADSLRSATPQKTVKLQPGENPDTYIEESDNLQLKIIGLEDRIGFLKEDAFNQDGKLNKDQQAAMDTLTTRLKQFRALQKSQKGK
tara:strand:+ start:188 stop:661 length:474 start_codon:yes stop_codon:yes gene_type:complete